MRGRLHSKLRDRRAISHHYDLSNEFYSLILEPQMAYSSAYFRSDDPSYTLEDAQRDKLDLVCTQARPRAPACASSTSAAAGARLSLHAAEHYGVQVTGVTIAAEQKKFIDERIHERGLSDRVEIRLQDYREIPEVPPVATSTPSARWRWASTSASRTTAPTPRSCTTRSSPAGAC